MEEELEILINNIFSNGAEEDEEGYKNNKNEIYSIIKNMRKISYKDGYDQGIFDERADRKRFNMMMTFGKTS